MTSNPCYILGQKNQFLSLEAPYALLKPNQTKSHHFIAQTEQRQHAFNRHVRTQNQNVYRWEVINGRVVAGARSVNIAHNLEMENLYTLAFTENQDRQYNLETWFNRYERGYSTNCALLRQLPLGRQPVSPELLTLLRLKLLGVLRNPMNCNDVFLRGLRLVVDEKLPSLRPVFCNLIEQRTEKKVRHILKDSKMSFSFYAQWLSDLYVLLSDGVSKPSLFERLFTTIFSTPRAVKILLYRYHQGENYYLFTDSGYAVSTQEDMLILSFSIASDMFIRVEIKRQFWQQLDRQFASKPHLAVNAFEVFDNYHPAREDYHHDCLQCAHQAVFGQSDKWSTYH